VERASLVDALFYLIYFEPKRILLY